MLYTIAVILLILWLLGFLQLGNNDVLRVTIVTIQDHPIRVLDALVAIVVIWLIFALPGPLAIAAGALLALWALTMAGIIAVQGLPINVLVILAILVGVMIHLVRRKRAA